MLPVSRKLVVVNDELPTFTTPARHVPYSRRHGCTNYVPARRISCGRSRRSLDPTGCQARSAHHSERIGLVAVAASSRCLRGRGSPRGRRGSPRLGVGVPSGTPGPRPGGSWRYWASSCGVTRATPKLSTRSPSVHAESWLTPALEVGGHGHRSPSGSRDSPPTRLRGGVPGRRRAHRRGPRRRHDWSWLPRRLASTPTASATACAARFNSGGELGVRRGMASTARSGCGRATAALPRICYPTEVTWGGLGAPEGAWLSHTGNT